jgi:hypothetical protein
MIVKITFSLEKIDLYSAGYKFADVWSDVTTMIFGTLYMHTRWTNLVIPTYREQKALTPQTVCSHNRNNLHGLRCS